MCEKEHKFQQLEKKERHIYLSVKNNAKRKFLFHTYAQPEVHKEALLQKNIVCNWVWVIF